MIFDSGKQEELIRRRLCFALLASLAAHALLLAADTVRPAVQQAAPRLLASFRLAPATVSPAPAAPPVAVTVPPHAGHREIPRRAVPPAPTFPAPAPVPLTTEVAPENIVANAVPAAAPPAAAPVVAGNGASSESPAPGLSADGLRRYRLSLAAQSRRFKRYPAQALASGWAGTAEIRLEIGGDGQGTATLLRSSGYVVLDRAAQAMVEAGAQHTPLPETLRGKTFSVVLPVLFELNDDG